MTTTSLPGPIRTGATPRPLERLEAELVELAGQIAGATARFITLVGEFDAAEGWRDWGMKSTAHWLAWKCGLGLVAGREQVRVARALRDLPLVAAEFAAGRLSYSKVRAVTRLATAQNERQLIDVARASTAAQLDRALARHRRAERNDNPDAHAKSEHLSYRLDNDGFLVGLFRIAPERAPVVAQGLDVLTGRVPELGSEGGDEGECAPVPVRRPSRADALVEMCERAIDHASAEASSAAAERYQLVIHSSLESLERPDSADDLGPATELHSPGGLAVRVSPGTARRLSCDCPSTVMVAGVDGSTIHVGRKTRRIVGRLRRAVSARDKDMCRTPGCTERATQIHHIRHWANGGSTCLSNLISLCDGHHWLVHEGGFTIVARGAAGWALLSPTGIVIEPTASSVEPSQPLPHDTRIEADAITGDWDGGLLRAEEVSGILKPVGSAPRKSAKGASAEASPAPEMGFQLSQSAIDHWCAMVADLEANCRRHEGIWVDD
jgi:hypothetical protein